MNTQNQSSNPKAQQFQEELNGLLKRYQYTLIPEIVVTKNGILPQIMIRDIVPAKNTPIVKEVKKSAKKKNK